MILCRELRSRCQQSMVEAPIASPPCTGSAVTTIFVLSNLAFCLAPEGQANTKPGATIQVESWRLGAIVVRALNQKPPQRREDAKGQNVELGHLMAGKAGRL
jgi:hypothetical protein